MNNKYIIAIAAITHQTYAKDSMYVNYLNF